MPRSEDARSHLVTLTADSKTPGLQYLVVNSDRILFEHCGGWANINRHVSMKPSTTMTAYSMSKTITAAAVLSLVQTGQVRLDEPLERWVPDSPYGPGIVVSQLLTHTSGMPNPLPLRWIHRPDQHQTFDEAAALESVLKGHPRLSHSPGTKYRYSNIGYWLLGRVVEAASGEPFTRYVDQHVLAPLGIEAGQLGYEIPDTSRHATGYLEKYSLMNLVKRFLLDRDLIGTYEGRWLRINSHYLNGPAFGGLVGTANGFATFLQDQLRQHSRLLEDAIRDQFYAPQQTAQGTPIPMTLGWHVGDLHGRRFFYKEGGGAGFHCMMRLYRAEGVASVIMANATGFDVKDCLNRVDQGFLH